MTTTESNKLIAEFMGIMDDYESGTIFIHDNYFLPEEFKYHTSWDWLMPVVEEIEATLDSDGYGNNVVIDNNLCTILSGNDGSIVIDSQEGINKLEATYKAVIQFINLNK